jgi:hypothetical protein
VPTPDNVELDKHPRGTLAVVALYGLLFAVGWLSLFLFVFLPRGTVTR